MAKVFTILLSLILISWSLQGVESESCCRDKISACPKCGGGLKKACDKVPKGSADGCGGTCACRKKDTCIRESGGECNGKKSKCKDDKENPFISCVTNSEGDDGLAYQSCECVDSPDCTKDADCQGEFVKLKCKEGEVGKCQLDCICAKK